MGRLLNWIRANWYTEVLPWTGAAVGVFGIMEHDSFKLALGAMAIAWAGWVREDEHGR